MFISVPRLFNKFHDTIKAKLAEGTGCKGQIATKAVRVKTANMEANGQYTHALYDKLVFKKMKEFLGGNVNMMLSGSAPIGTEVRKFMKLCFCCPFLEGYGQTEGLGGQFCSHMHDNTFGHVGTILPHNEFKLVDVPEMKYLSTDVDKEGRPSPRGEIWTRGPNIIPGYYKNEEKNKETFTEDGWLMSGDIGQLLPGNNSLRIIDRKKNIFKLAQGEYVAPDKLEQVYKNIVGISDIFVYGDSFKSVLVGIVNLDNGALKVATDIGIEDPTLESLAGNAKFNAHIIKLLKDK